MADNVKGPNKAAGNAANEIQDATRDLADRGVQQARDNYARVRSAAEEATDFFEETFQNASKGVVEFNTKAIDLARENANNVFDFARQLTGARSLSEAIELQTSFMRRQYEAAVSQSRELGEIANRVTRESARPVTEGVQRATREFRVQ
jgi:phasin